MTILFFIGLFRQGAESIHPSKVNQIRNNVVCVVALLVIVFFVRSLRAVAMLFAIYFRNLKEIGVLPPILPDCFFL